MKQGGQVDWKPLKCAVSRLLPWQLFTMNTTCYLHTHTLTCIHMAQVINDVITLHFSPPSLSLPVVDTTTDQSQNGRSSPLA